MPGRRDLFKQAAGVAAAVGLATGAETNMVSAQEEPGRKLALVVLDRSSSMWNQRDATIAGLNKFLDEQRNLDLHIGLIQFDSMSNPEITPTFEFQHAKNAPVIGEADYMPRGSTPLLWAVTEAIARMEKALRPQDSPPLIVVQTDGAENTSPPEITKEAVLAMTKAKEAEGWVFAFLGAGIDAWSSGGQMGVQRGSTISYVNSKSGTQSAWGATAAATQTWTTGVTARGQSVGSQNFYSNTDVSEYLAQTDQTKNLTQYDTSGGVIDASLTTTPAEEPKKIRKPRQYKSKAE